MTEIVLSVLLIVTNAFWAFFALNLLDRLMSRNYVEFAQGKSIIKPKPSEKEGPLQLVEDPIDTLQAQEMNALIGIV